MMETTLPLITAGVPVYNCRATVGRLLDSLLSQDAPNLEIVISDNASTDGTYELCREYAARDPRIRLTRNPENLGVGENFRKVCALARGTYFFWAAGDDWYQPEYASTLARALEDHPEAVVAVCRVTRQYLDGEMIDEVGFAGARDPGRHMPWWLMLKLVLHRTAEKYQRYNFFFLGVFRYDRIREFNHSYPYTTLGERPFLAALAASHPFLYVDRNLMVKVRHRERFTVRNPEDPYSRKGKMTGLRDRYSRIARVAWTCPETRSHRARANILAAMSVTFAYAGYLSVRQAGGSLLRRRRNES